MIQFGEQWVCAGCKPDFIQMLRQGVNMPLAMRYAGFWIRFAAKFLDGLISGAAVFALLMPLTLLVPPGRKIEDDPLLHVVQILFQIILPMGYATFFVGKYRATPGKMACGLAIIRADGSKVSYMRALGRHFAEFLSGVTLLIGYIMAGFDSEKRALHDRICDTRVVRK